MNEVIKVKLYHISAHLENKEIFHPKIPNYRLKGENEIIKRISVSDSIEGCLTGMPNGGSSLGETLNQTNRLLKVFEFDLNEVNLAKGSVIPPHILFKNGWVIDALRTNEHWITQSIKPSNQYLIEVIRWEEYDEPVIPEYLDMKINDEVMTIIESVIYATKEMEMETK